jgi:hypothetical protein
VEQSPQASAEPRNLDPLDLIEDLLGSLVRDALEHKRIIASRTAENFNIGIEAKRERIKSLEEVS